MENLVQPTVFITPESKNYKPPKNWKPFILIGIVIVIIGGLSFAGYYYRVQLQKGLEKINDRFGINTLSLKKESSKKPVEQVISKVNKITKTGEFLIVDPTPNSRQTPPKTELQIVVRGNYNLETAKIDIQDTKVQDSVKYSDSALIPPKISWIMVDMVSLDKVIYQTRFPLFLQPGKQLIPFYIVLPYEKSFTLKIYNQSKKLLLSQLINL